MLTRRRFIMLATASLVAHSLPAQSSFLNQESSPGQRLKKWEEQVSMLSNKPLYSILPILNRSINSLLVYRNLIGEEWRSPNVSVARGYGDCNDYAITKYFSLLHLFPHLSDRIRLIYGYYQPIRMSSEFREAHLMLGLFEDPHDPIILDNLVNTVTTLSERDDLSTLMMFNNHKLWTIADPVVATGQDPKKRIGNWGSVIRQASSAIKLFS